ncbi:MAG TPA: hypothetical protein VIT42_01590 [Microlunatus sp.]
MGIRTPAAVAATAFALMLTGCFGGAPAGEQSTVPQQSSGPVEIRYMIGSPEDAADLEVIKQDIKKFESTPDRASPVRWPKPACCTT